MPIYHNNGEGWRMIDRWAYANEEELERFILDNPAFIAGEREDVWTVWARQVGPRADNQLDLLGLGSDGSITIVECKLGSNREERREVIAQVLEYASGLWKMKLDRFREVFRKQHSSGRDPFDLLVESAPPSAGAEEWDIEQARRVAELNLEHGRFRLVVAVDEISQRLRDIVDYVNSSGRGELKIVAIALARYGDSVSGVVAPQIHGDRAPAPAARSADAVGLSVAEVLGQAAPDMRPVVTKVHEFLDSGPSGTGRLVARTGKQSISYDGRSGAGTTFPLMRLWPKSGRKTDPQSSSHLDIYPTAMSKLGTSSPAVRERLVGRGFESYGDGVRLGPGDLNRLNDLFEVLDAEVLSRLDA